ncbi:hypothetical protein Bca4012_008813 [Brassica carinata]
MPFTLFSEVKPFKCGWKVHVKVLHSWKQYNSISGETLEMILSDERVFKVGTNVKTLNGQEITSHIWWCEVCKKNVTYVSPRFKLHLMVKDYTGEARLMLLNKVARGLISESATELLNGSFDEVHIYNPDDLPEAITRIVFETYTFGIYVEKEHIVYGSEIYKVGRVYKDWMECLNNDRTQTDSLSDRGVTLTKDNNDEMSTPSTKRKDDSVGAISVSSKTRNLRSKVVKVEKMPEL